MNVFKHYVDGTLKTVVAWELNGKVSETNFLTKISVKWDGCSHAWFNGEDYCESDGDSETCDSYYHLCGIGDYFAFTRGLIFAFFAASECIELCEYELKKMNDCKDILKGYNIIFIDNNSRDYLSEEYIYSQSQL